MIAALFVDAAGRYAEMPDVDAWDISRDATLYAGPWSVVAHPPCARWSVLAGLVEAVYGIPRHEDGGLFASALASVRRWGGVLEHPAQSAAWARFELPRPPARGGWVRGLCGGWSCHVEQGRYGHAAKKATWLYAHGVAELPSLVWGQGDEAKALVSWCANHVSSGEVRPRVGKKQASITPAPFLDLLLSMARSVVREPA